MNGKKILAALSAAAVSMTILPFSAFAEQTADELTIEQCIDYVNEMTDTMEQNAPDVGVYVTAADIEDADIVRKVLEYDNKGIDRVYKAAINNCRSDHYYAQLTSAQQAAYRKLDEACAAFLESDVDLSTDVFDQVTFDTPLDSADDYNQVYWCFYYSNPQYFFLKNYASYYINRTTQKIVAADIYTYDNCQNAAVKSEIKSGIDSRVKSYISSVSSLSADYEKETAIAKLISDDVDYISADYNQSTMGALYFNKCVCNGYAMAMNYLCNTLGYECITVTSSNHAWNRVKLSGEWYEADVTWYDQTDNSTVYWDIWLNNSTANFLSNDQNGSHIVETSKPMYNNITLPSCTDDDPSDNAPAVPDAPVITSAEPGENKVTLKWNAVSGADSYKIYYRVSGTTQWQLYNNTTYTYQNVNDLTGGTQYDFLVRAVNTVGLSEYEDTDIVSATPTAPAVELSLPKFTATAGDGKIDLTWTAVDGATGYRVIYIDTLHNNKVNLGVTGTSYTVKNLTNGTPYKVIVLAANGSSTSSYTDSDFQTVTPCAPLALPEFTATAGDGKIDLTWTAVDGATGYRVIYTSSSNSVSYVNTTRTSYTIKNLVNGTPYRVIVLATCGTNSSSYTDSDYQTVTPAAPAAPLALPKFTATAGDGKIDLTWTAVSGAASYKILCNSLSGNTSVTVTTSQTSYTIDKLTNGTAYKVIVLAVNGDKVSSYTDSDYQTVTLKSTTVDLALPKFTATAGDGKIDLSWTAVEGAEIYKILCSSLLGNTSVTVTTSQTSYTIDKLTNGTAYKVIVLAVNGDKVSSYTDSDYQTVTLKSTTVDLALPKFTATAGDGKIDLTWTAVEGATGYKVIYVNTLYNNRISLGVTGTSYTVKNLTNGTPYKVIVLAVNGDNVSSYTDSDFLTVTPKAAATAPAKPVFTVTAGTNSVSLKWNAVSGVTGYRVLYCANGTSTWSQADTTATSYTVTGLKASTKYDFVVLSVNGTEVSDYTDSDIVSATTKAATVTPPALPYFTATAGTNSVSLRWNAVSGAKSYRVYYRLNGMNKWTTRNTTGTAVTISNLIGGRKYDFLVLAYNGLFSKWTNSDIKIVAPKAAYPAVPSLTLTPGVNKMTLKWNAVSGARSYRVYYRLNGTAKWTYRNTIGTSVTILNLTGGRKYDFLVLAYNGAFSKWTNSDIKVAAPTAGNKPVISSVTPGVNSAVLRWNAVSGAQSYRVYYRISGTSRWYYRNTTVNAMNLRGLTGGRTYEFLVRSYNGSTWSSYTSADIVKATIKS